jgi:hypothetical protein
MNSQHESDLDAQKNEYDLKLADKMLICDRLSTRLKITEDANKEEKIPVGRLKAELSAATSSFDEKVVAEVARATVTFNDKLATELLDVAAHFDAKLATELAAASSAVEAKHAAEMTSVLAEFEKKMYAAKRG